MNFLDIQSWWEIPSIAHFCSLFRYVFNLPAFDIEDFEEALLLAVDDIDNVNRGLLIDLIVRLLNGSGITKQEITARNYDEYLKQLFNDKCAVSVLFSRLPPNAASMKHLTNLTNLTFPAFPRTQHRNTILRIHWTPMPISICWSHAPK